MESNLSEPPPPSIAIYSRKTALIYGHKINNNSATSIQFGNRFKLFQTDCSYPNNSRDRCTI